MYCIRHIQNSDISSALFFRYIPANPGILRLILVFSASCVNLVYSKPCNILSPSIFRTEGLLKTLWRDDQAYSEPCHRALFRHIQNFVQHLYTQQSGSNILGILEYSEPFHNCTLTHIQNPLILTKIYEYSWTLTHLKPGTYSEDSQRFKIELFAKIVKRYNYFSKMLRLRSLTGLWKRQSFNMEL